MQHYATLKARRAAAAVMRSTADAHLGKDVCDLLLGAVLGSHIRCRCAAVVAVHAGLWAEVVYIFVSTHRVCSLHAPQLKIPAAEPLP